MFAPIKNPRKKTAYWFLLIHSPNQLKTKSPSFAAFCTPPAEHWPDLDPLEPGRRFIGNQQHETIGSIVWLLKMRTPDKSLRFIHGLSMVYPWCIHGLSMVYPWFIHGLSMVYSHIPRLFPWFSHVFHCHRAPLLGRKLCGRAFFADLDSRTAGSCGENVWWNLVKIVETL